MVGCISVPFVEDELMEAAIDTANFKCREPFELTQDCSSISYALREISIDGQNMKIAGSERGDIVLVNSATAWSDCLSNILLLNCPSLGRKANSAYVTLRDYLSNSGVKIRRVIPHTSFGSTIGYYVVLDSNGYDLLKTLSTSGTTDNPQDNSPLEQVGTQ